MLSLGSYLLGVVQVAVVALALGFSAYRLRQRLLPIWDGAPARLVEAIVAVALLIWLSEILGAFGLFYAGTLVAASILLALAITVSPAGGGGAGVPRGAENSAEQSSSTVGEAPPTGPAGRSDLNLDELKRVWPAALQKLGETAPALAATFEGAYPVALDEEGLKIGFPADKTFNKRKAEGPERRQAVAAALLAVTGQDLKPTYVLFEGEGETPADEAAAVAADEKMDEEELLQKLKSEFDAEEVG